LYKENLKKSLMSLNHKHLIILSLSYIILSICPLSAQEKSHSQSQKEEPIRYTIQYDGIEREYYIFLPKDFNPTKTYWGLVVAHGGGNNGKGYWLTKHMRSAADSNGLQAVIISPSFLLDKPNEEQFPILGEGLFLKRMLHNVHHKYKLHPKILLTGYSRGGQFSHRFALLNPDIVKACAPMAAGSWTTPDGKFFLTHVGEVENPEEYLSIKENSKDVDEKKRILFTPEVAKVAAIPAAPGAKKIPFLVMCGTLDNRLEIAKEFAKSLKNLDYKVETKWPQTPHGGVSKDEFKEEFRKYSQTVAKFFLEATECK
jgi:pimeloyl-ACP methyl ester carboxylesterase